VAHEVGVDVERYSVVVFEELEVAHQVYYQKGAEKQAREGHDNLAADAASEGFGKPIHMIVNKEKTYLNRPKVAPDRGSPKLGNPDACYLEWLNIALILTSPWP
jgi:hypothetical protein